MPVPAIYMWDLAICTHTRTHTHVAEWTSVTGRSGGGIRYVSRLEAIKEAVSRQLEHLAITEPKNKVSTKYVCVYEALV